MIVKERTFPQKILFYEAVLRRLSEHHPNREWIYTNLLRKRSGYKGELNSDYYLNLLIDDHINFLHDIRLPHNKTFFQIDTLMLSSNFALIIGVKNIAGKLFFDRKHKQLIRTQGEKQEGFADPIEQAKRHSYQLKYWFSKNQISLPIEWVVVVGKPSTIIETDSKSEEILNNLCHAEHLLEKIEELKIKHQTSRLDQKSLDELSSALLNQHVPEAKPSIEQYNVSESDLKTGVQCPYCQSLPMSRRRGTWYCPTCKKYSKDAHYQAIGDYALIFGSFITNQQFRTFLHVSSRYVAIRLINSLNLQPVGSKKGTRYIIPDGLCNKKGAKVNHFIDRSSEDCNKSRREHNKTKEKLPDPMPSQQIR